jgi:hypothetical protein
MYRSCPIYIIDGGHLNYMAYYSTKSENEIGIFENFSNNLF